MAQEQSWDHPGGSEQGLGWVEHRRAWHDAPVEGKLQLGGCLGQAVSLLGKMFTQRARMSYFLRSQCGGGQGGCQRETRSTQGAALAAAVAQAHACGHRAGHGDLVQGPAIPPAGRGSPALPSSRSRHWALLQTPHPLTGGDGSWCSRSACAGLGGKAGSELRRARGRRKSPPKIRRVPTCTRKRDGEGAGRQSLPGLFYSTAKG